jgi:hypothetical protein
MSELLQQIEESLAHSREVIAQINEFLAQRHAKQAIEYSWTSKCEGLRRHEMTG